MVIFFYNPSLITNVRYSSHQQALKGQPHIFFQNRECWRQVTELTEGSGTSVGVSQHGHLWAQSHKNLQRQRRP